MYKILQKKFEPKPIHWPRTLNYNAESCRYVKLWIQFHLDNPEHSPDKTFLLEWLEFAEAVEKSIPKPIISDVVQGEH